MVKLLGMLSVFTASSVMGFIMAGELGERTKMLKDIYQSATHIKSELEYRGADICDCFNRRGKLFSIAYKYIKSEGLLPAEALKKAADEAVKRIAAIYHTDHVYKDTSPKEILDNRQQSVKPLVDAYFAWIKELLANPGLDSSSSLRTALNYSVNQEPYLRTFLEDSEIPLDNNDAERSIKKFCVGKHSWHIIESKNGAKASAMMYSIAETAKANGLNPSEYFQHLLEQLKEYPRNNVPDDKLEELMPWSPQLPDKCKQQLKR